MSTATLETLNQQRADLIRQAATSGKPIDPAAVAEIESAMAEARQAASLEREVSAARASIEVEKRRTSDAEHLAGLVQIVEQKATQADELAAEIETDLEALRAKITAWQGLCRDMQSASGDAHSFGRQVGMTAAIKGAPRQDVALLLTYSGDYDKKPVRTIGRTFVPSVR